MKGVPFMFRMLGRLYIIELKVYLEAYLLHYVSVQYARTS